MDVYPPKVERSSVNGGTRGDKLAIVDCSSKSVRVDLLRVLMVTPRYHPYIGGVETHVHEVAQRLVRAGIDMTVLTTDPSGQLPAEEQSDGVRIQRVRAWPVRGDFYFAPRIYSIIANGNWDVVHIQSYHTFVAPLSMLAAWRNKIPYVVTFHGGGHSSRLRNTLRQTQYMVLRPFLAHAERLVATAKFEIKFYGEQLRLPTERFVLIPNGADLPKAAEPITMTKTKDALIVSVGRLERYKGHHRIIEALPYVLEQYPNMRLWIMGSGPYESTLRRIAIKLGVTDYVDIRAIPPSDREKMTTELGKAALVVLLSEYETHPMAVLEALALGCSILVADTSGLSELAEQGLVRAIPMRSTTRQVATAILDQLRQPLAPQPIKLPTWDECAADLVSLYSTLTQRAKCVS